MTPESNITSINIQLDFFSNKPGRVETLHLGHVYTISYISRKKNYTRKGVIKDIRASYMEDKFIISLEYSTNSGIKTIEIFQDDIIDVKKDKNVGPEKPGRPVPPKPPVSIGVFTTTSREYSNMAKHDPNIIYFLSDTKEIYKGDINYTSNSSIILVSDFPEKGEQGKLYLKNDGSEGKIYNDTGEVSIIRPIDNIISDEDTSNDNNLATVGAIKQYLADGINSNVETIVVEIEKRVETNVSETITETVNNTVKESVDNNIDSISTNIQTQVESNVLETVEEMIKNNTNYDDGEF